MRWCWLAAAAAAGGPITANEIDQLEGAVDPLEGRAQQVGVAAGVLEESVQRTSQQVKAQKTQIDKAKNFRMANSAALEKITANQAAFQAWRNDYGARVEKNRAILENATSVVEETRRYLQKNGDVASTNKQRIQSIRETNGKLKSFVEQHAAEVEENTAWMKENKKKIEDNANAVAEAWNFIGETKEFLNQNTMKIKQNAHTISLNSASIGRHTRAIAKLEADALESRAAANKNQVWMEANRDEIEENAKFIEQNQKFLSKQGEFIRKNRNSVQQNKATLATMNLKAEEVAEWIEKNEADIETNRKFIAQNRKGSDANRKRIMRNMHSVKLNAKRLQKVGSDLMIANEDQLHNHQLITQLYSVWDELNARMEQMHLR
jgi:methyl-accepting chemotaxis protein